MYSSGSAIGRYDVIDKNIYTLREIEIVLCSFIHDILIQLLASMFIYKFVKSIRLVDTIIDELFS